MGLCKCPKRKVTNLFCFEHRVNVCEHCLVSNHNKCIVQSYLQWLQDSDYNPNCSLCNNLLSANETVRLVCYDVFHWACLNDLAARLPLHTAPAGYQCPSCQGPVFPPSNLASPVADMLKEQLSSVNWARAGLGLPLIEEPIEVLEESTPSDTADFSDWSTFDAPRENSYFDSSAAPRENAYFDPNAASRENAYFDSNAAERPRENAYFDSNAASRENAYFDSNAAERPRENVYFDSNAVSREKAYFDSSAAAQGTSEVYNMDAYSSNTLAAPASIPPPAQEDHGGRHLNAEPPVMQQHSFNPAPPPCDTITLHAASSPRKVYDTRDVAHSSVTQIDFDDDKYRRRPTLSWFAQILKNRTGKRSALTTKQRIFMLLLVGVIGFFTLIIIMAKLGRASSDSDPNLDPLNNPNIHVGKN